MKAVGKIALDLTHAFTLALVILGLATVTGKRAGAWTTCTSSAGPGACGPSVQGGPAPCTDANLGAACPPVNSLAGCACGPGKAIGGNDTCDCKAAPTAM